MIKDGQVVIVDEFTGRLMPGRRWSDGLHQAVEAKEKVKIERENQTLATITFQNYFRKYKKLSGMTGTADTEAEEFAKIYKLDVNVIPTNRPLVRVEEPDIVYRTEREKYEAIVNDIIEKQTSGRPTLVGTVSIEKSEKLSTMLKRRGIKHVVLNAKYHAQEAEIVAQAGRKDNVTIATNMAGRGTDILLGGNAEYMARQQSLAEENVAEKLTREQFKFVDDDEFVYFFHIDSFYRVPRADWERIFGFFKQQCDAEHDDVVGVGGLHIIGTERHEARRIDNQLRGRAGRQGDPGSSRFYLSLEDDLMRIFGSDRISGLMQRLGMEEGVPIEHGMVTRAIERAQKQVEAQNFSVRKHLLEYDDVMNKQRENIYSLRRELLEGEVRMAEDEDPIDTHGYLLEIAEDVLGEVVERYAGAETDPDEWDGNALRQEVTRVFGLDPESLKDDRRRRAEHDRDLRRDLGSCEVELRREDGCARPGLHAEGRARHHAADRRRAVEGSPLQPRPPEGRHRPARLRPARPARRVQARELHALPGHEGARGRGDGPRDVVAATGLLRGRRPGRARAASRAATDPAHPQRPRRRAQQRLPGTRIIGRRGGPGARCRGRTRSRRRNRSRPARAATTRSRR